MPLELLQDSDSIYEAIALHWSSSYPEYVSPYQDKEEQRRVVWSRLHSHRANLAKRLSKQNERYLALRQELNLETTQVESSHEPLSHDIKSNLPMASRAEKVFKEGVPLNRRGERNIPKRYLQVVVYSPDEQGYFVYHNDLYIAVEFDFTHCFWYTVKYNNQESCWKTFSIPEPDIGLYILDSEVVDRSEWGPVDNGRDSSDEEDETKSKAHPESIDIKISTQEEEKTERQLEKLAEQFPALSRLRSHTATSRLPPITAIMATQTTTEPTHTISTEEGTSSA